MSTEIKNINEAWLNLDIGDEKVFNPFKIVNFNDDDYHYKMLWL